MDTIMSFIENSKAWLSIPDIEFIDWIEILIIAYLVYHIIIWVKDTRAWMLLKGIVVILIFSLIASLLNLSVILWILSNTINVGIILISFIFDFIYRRCPICGYHIKINENIKPGERCKKCGNLFYRIDNK